MQLPNEVPKNIHLAPAKQLNYQNIIKFPKDLSAKLQHIINTNELLSCKFFREQVYVLLKNAPELKCRQISFIFNCNPKSVYDQIQAIERKNELKCGWPSIITEEISNSINEYILKCSQDQQYPTLNDILNHIFLCNEAKIMPETLRKWIHRQKNLKIVDASPIEDARNQVRFEDISNYFSELEKIIGNYPSAFLFNVDESEFDKFVDQRNCSLVVPSNLMGSNWFYPV